MPEGHLVGACPHTKGRRAPRIARIGYRTFRTGAALFAEIGDRDHRAAAMGTLVHGHADTSYRTKSKDLLLARIR